MKKQDRQRAPLSIGEAWAEVFLAKAAMDKALAHLAADGGLDERLRFLLGLASQRLGRIEPGLRTLDASNARRARQAAKAKGVDPEAVRRAYADYVRIMGTPLRGRKHIAKRFGITPTRVSQILKTQK